MRQLARWHDVLPAIWSDSSVLTSGFYRGWDLPLWWTGQGNAMRLFLEGLQWRVFCFGWLPCREAERQRVTNYLGSLGRARKARGDTSGADKIWFLHFLSSSSFSHPCSMFNFAAISSNSYLFRALNILLSNGKMLRADVTWISACSYWSFQTFKMFLQEGNDPQPANWHPWYRRFGLLSCALGSNWPINRYWQRHEDVLQELVWADMTRNTASKLNARACWRGQPRPASVDNEARRISGRDFDSSLTFRSFLALGSYEFEIGAEETIFGRKLVHGTMTRAMALFYYKPNSRLIILNPVIDTTFFHLVHWRALYLLVVRWDILLLLTPIRVTVNLDTILLLARGFFLGGLLQRRELSLSDLDFIHGSRDMFNGLVSPKNLPSGEGYWTYFSIPFLASLFFSVLTPNRSSLSFTIFQGTYSSSAMRSP